MIEAEPSISLALPRSRCPACGHQITWFENIPVLSFLVLRGRCSNCSARISWRYPAVEAVTGAMFAACAWHFGPRPEVLLWSGVLATLLALALIDFDTQLLPDRLTQPLLWAGLLAAAMGWTGTSLREAVFGAAGGYAFLWLLANGYRLVRRRDGMGAGDFKLLAALGAWFGMDAVPAIILASAAVGVVAGVISMTRARDDLRHQIPFGPYLAAAGVVATFSGGLTGWFSQ